MRALPTRLAVAVLALPFAVAACSDDPAGGASSGKSVAPGGSPTSPLSTAAAGGDTDEQWLADACAALAEWLSDADGDEDSLRALALGASEDDPAALRRAAVSVVEGAERDVRALAGELGSLAVPADPALVDFDADMRAVLAETAGELDRLGASVAALPVDSRQALVAAGSPLVVSLLEAEERLVGRLTAAVVRVRASSAAPLVARTPSCGEVAAELETPGP